MAVVHYFEGRLLVLSRLMDEIPTAGQDIKIKGRKGKVAGVSEKGENIFHVQVTFEPVVKRQALLSDNKKKRR
ncbi:hypothetical protein BpJC7_01680 [Weizmannia acidilactici]|uniref:Uncharacterized protein n=1 Tax=Weizmannia acidilactici TaxID=2607726 RepID=A0A5J4JE51_9BACI|nr:hypothetical protein [Weizmannia acidilactici]GER66591.1 hypothetical protein BpJC4_10620 [Weizmannia acidilactici]GER68865.1 hypothetical protein BpJC7_01680 [Weizmannia acidilactici]GER73490.1 hypothetical protein BpPP18_15570 [Weizmannia acidilactici]